MAAAGVALLLPAGPADARRSCGAVRAGAPVVVKTREAVVFTRRGIYYGCHRSVGRAFRLQTYHAIRDPRLAGRYVAYVVRVEEFMEPVFDRIEVFDLVRGRVKFAAGANDFVDTSVLKRNGSVAWIEHSGDQPPDAGDVYEVRRISNEDRAGNILVDRGSEIDPVSLALSADRRSILWTHAGEVRTAPLR